MRYIESTGEVWLVGAGPGDPGLLTEAGREALERADVIVHDRLGSEAILEKFAHVAAQLIDAGKLPGDRRDLQDDINAVLYQEAAEGRFVVRLKGGDPFVFGRGFEEYEYLVSRGVRTRIVPGVTSALAASVGGLAPATVRGNARSFAVVTGHQKDDGIAATPRADTLFYLMAMGRLERVAEQLQSDGWSEHTPAALVTDASTYRQRAVHSTLGGIAAEVRREGLKPPGVLIVGDSAGAADSLPFPTHQPTVVLTEQGTPTRERFSAISPSVSLLPRPLWTVEQLSLASEPGLAQRLAEALRLPWIAFEDGEGVAGFVDLLLQSGLDLRSLRGRIAAAGDAAADGLRAVGIVPDLFVSDAGELANRLRSDGAALATATDAADSGLLHLPTYRRNHRQPRPVDWAFTEYVSLQREAAVARFVAAYPAAPLDRLTAVVGDDSTARAAAKAGFRAVITNLNSHSTEPAKLADLAV